MNYILHIYIYTCIHRSHGNLLASEKTDLFSLLPHLANHFCAKSHPTLAVEPLDSKVIKLIFH